MNKREFLESGVIHRDGNMELKIYPLVRSYCHWHEELEFIYPTSGFCVTTVNGEQITVHQGQALLISGGELHCVTNQHPVPGGAIVLHAHICGSECAHLFSNYHVKQIFDSIDPNDRSILQFLAQIYDAYQKRDFAYELKIRAYTAEVFRIIFENRLFREKKQLQEDAVDAFEKMVTFTHENFSRKITLDDLSAHCNYSKPYVIRLFKQYAGTTPTDYINRYRITKAQMLFASDDKNVLEVALECGFENVGYFIRMFKKYTGQTPGKWKRN